MTKILALTVLTLWATPASARWFEKKSGTSVSRASYRPPVVPVYSGKTYSFPKAALVQAGASQARPVQAQGAVIYRSTRRDQPAPAAAVNQVSANLQAAPQPRGIRYIKPPAVDQKGKTISAKLVPDLSSNHAVVQKTLASPAVVQSAQQRAGADHDGQFHWYKSHGVRLSHWYDQARQREWWGFYQGPNYFWTVAWHDHFWWQEPRSGRWLVFWKNQWWWHAPDNAYYVFIGGQYYLWNPQPGGAVLVPEEAPAAQPAPEPAPEPSAWLAPARWTPTAKPVSETETMIVSTKPEFYYSADGTRVVQVEGEGLKAYLYDTTKMDSSGGNRFIKELGEGVTGVQFSDTTGGDPLRIMMTVQDKNGAVRDLVLDSDGNPVSGPRPLVHPPVIFGAQGAPGFDAPPAQLPPSDAPMPDGN